MFIIKHRYAFYFGIVFFLLSLFLHDRNLYPHAGLWDLLTLMLLRFSLLALPVAFGWFIVTAKTTGFTRVLLFGAWLFFLPYTIYSVTEIRHAAEVCRLAAPLVYTQVCVDRLWMLFPTFIYAFVGTVAFVFTVVQVMTHCISRSDYKRFWIALITLYASAAAVFGLYTRLNIWAVFTKPLSAYVDLGRIAANPNFYLNTVFFWAFALSVTFLLHRVLYRAREYLFHR